MENRAERDSKLWSDFIGGDESAFVKLYEGHYQELFRYGMRISFDRDLTKDCLQEMFTYLWTKRKLLSEVTFVKAYLYKYMGRLVKSNIQKGIKNKVREKELIQHTDFIIDYETKLATESHQSDDKSRLQKAIKSLTKRQKQIITLKFFDGCDYEEIMEITGLKQKTVYNLAHEAINALKKAILFALTIMKFFS